MYLVAFMLFFLFGVLQRLPVALVSSGAWADGLDWACAIVFGVAVAAMSAAATRARPPTRSPAAWYTRTAISGAASAVPFIGAHAVRNTAGGLLLAGLYGAVVGYAMLCFIHGRRERRSTTST
jgi:hypothetical protein